MKPLVNVVIPTRDRAETLFWSLKTCCNQSYENYRIWVSDNCSGDNTGTIVREFSDERITYLKTPRPLSMSHNWEFAVEHLEEGYAIFLGDDDGLVPNAVAALALVIEHTGALALRSPNITYYWPTVIDEFMRGRLSNLPVRDDFRWVEAGALLQAVAENLEYYHPYFLNLPTIYHGCVSVELINRVKHRDGQFFGSACPDMYSAVIVAGEVERFIELRYPVCINGLSGRSTGISNAWFHVDDTEIKKALAEDLIPYDEQLFPGGIPGCSILSRPILIADQFLKAHRKNPAVPVIDLKNVIQRSLASTQTGRWRQREQYDNIIETTRTVAQANGLTEFAEGLIAQTPFVPQPPRPRFKTSFDPYSKIWCIDTLEHDISNVYEVSLLIGKILSEAGIAQAQPDCEGPTTTAHPEPADPTSSPFLNPPLTPDNVDSYWARSSILRALKEVLPRLHGTLLDIGCGEMPYKPLLTVVPSRVTQYLGLDIENPKYQTQVKPDLFWDGHRIDLPDQGIDCAVATEFLEHIPEPLSVMCEIRRVLKPEGLFFLTVPFLWPPHHEYRYTPYALERLLKQAGFTEICLKALGGWDASLAQMIGLWLKRRPMAADERAKYTEMLYPVYRELIAQDEPPSQFRSQMITGLAGTAINPTI